MNALFLVIGVYALLSLCLLPFQYKYIEALKEREKERIKLGLSQNEYYEKMGFETQQIHFHAQGVVFLGANLLATLIYNWRHKK